MAAETHLEPQAPEWAARALSSALDAIITIGGDGKVVQWNGAAEALFGYTRDEVVGRPLAELIIPPSQRAAHWAGLLRILSGGKPRILDRRIEVRARTRDGRLVPVELTVTRSSEDPPLFTGFVRDLSPLRSAREEANRARSVLEAGEQLSRMGSWEHDFVTQTGTWSPELYRIFGREPGHVAPTLDELLEMIHPDDRDRIAALLGPVFEDPAAYAQQPIAADARVVLPDGGVRVIEGRGAVLPDARGKPRRWVGYGRDVTDQRQTRRQLDAHHALGRTLAEWDSSEENYVDLVDRLASALDFPMGSLWTWDAAVDRITCRVFWTAPGVRGGDFEVITRRTALRPGEGLAGHVWEEGVPLAAPDLSAVLHYRRRGPAAALGLRSGLALPAVGEDGPLAVVSFYAFDARRPDPQMRATLTDIGRQLGAFLAEHRENLGPQILSDRELEILRLAAEGNTGPEIAEQLVLSALTVKTHFANIYGKLGVSDRAAAVAQAFRLGLVR
jgi:PAS domain S-box-containing protein